MFFLKQINVKFARKKGSKDKQKRKARLNAALKTGLTLGTIGGYVALPFITSKVGGNIYKLKNNKRVTNLLKERMNTSKLNIYHETTNDLLSRGLSLEESLNTGQKAVNEYEKLQNLNNLKKQFYMTDNGMSKARRDGFRYGLYGQVGLAGATIGSSIYKANYNRLMREKKNGK